MRMNKQIVVTDWIKEKPKLGTFLKLTLSSEERRILRGKRLTDCDQEIILQLPREGKLNDGDILSTNESNFYVEIIAKTENLIEISSILEFELISIKFSVLAIISTKKLDSLVKRISPSFNVPSLGNCKIIS